jgi:hypothetical protein
MLDIPIAFSNNQKPKIEMLTRRAASITKTASSQTDNLDLSGDDVPLVCFIILFRVYFRCLKELAILRTQQAIVNITGIVHPNKYLKRKRPNLHLNSGPFLAIVFNN